MSLPFFVSRKQFVYDIRYHALIDFKTVDVFNLSRYLPDSNAFCVHGNDFIFNAGEISLPFKDYFILSSKELSQSFGTSKCLFFVYYGLSCVFYHYRNWCYLYVHMGHIQDVHPFQFLAWSR